jgi:hypothetical protein
MEKPVSTRCMSVHSFAESSLALDMFSCCLNRAQMPGACRSSSTILLAAVVGDFLPLLLFLETAPVTKSTSCPETNAHIF